MVFLGTVNCGLTAMTIELCSPLLVRKKKNHKLFEIWLHTMLRRINLKKKCHKTFCVIITQIIGRDSSSNAKEYRLRIVKLQVPKIFFYFRFINKTGTETGRNAVIKTRRFYFWFRF